MLFLESYLRMQPNYDSRIKLEVCKWLFDYTWGGEELQYSLCLSRSHIMGKWYFSSSEYVPTVVTIRFVAPLAW